MESISLEFSSDRGASFLDGNPLPTTAAGAISPQLQPEMSSPSLAGVDVPGNQAFEMKFVVPPELAAVIQDWARHHMQPDPHVEREQDDSYRIHTVYLDTPELDMFHRRDGYRNEKYRLRRYETASVVFLEHKMRKGDRVAKERSELPLNRLEKFFSQGHSRQPSLLNYRRTLQEKRLEPVCRMTYRRAAYMRREEHGIVRLTLDRHIRGEATRDWRVDEVPHGTLILANEIIFEIKFREALPLRYRELVAELKLEPGAVSKYRRFLQTLTGLVPGNPAPGVANNG